MRSKTCTKCKQEKSISEFYKDKRVKDRYRSECKNCQKFSTLNYKYGLILNDWNELFEKQQGCCAICGTHQSELERKLFVDHDHTTGKLRGLLCSKCNTALGYLQENINIINSLLGYVQKYKNI